MKLEAIIILRMAVRRAPVTSFWAVPERAIHFNNALFRLTRSVSRRLRSLAKANPSHVAGPFRSDFIRPSGGAVHLLIVEHWHFERLNPPGRK